jgi:hypothetical protein
MRVHWTAATTLADRLTRFIDGLCRTIGAEAQARRMDPALAWAIWNRVRILGARLIALAERKRGGRVRVMRAARPVTGPRAPRSSRAQCKAASGLPGDFGWVKRLLPETAQYAGVLSYLLGDPELIALLEEVPQSGRALRPLCHLLGVKAPEVQQAARFAGEEPPPHLTSLPPGAERDDAAVAPPAEVVASAEAAGPAEAVAQPPPAPATAWGMSTNPYPDEYYKRPGGLYWDGKRMQWA